MRGRGVMQFFRDRAGADPGDVSRAGSSLAPGDHCGWIYLLPQGRRRHLICLDDGDHSITALADWCERLTVVCHTRERAALVAAESAPAGLADVRGVAAVDVREGLDAGLPVDGVVCNLLACNWVSSADIEPLFATLKRLLGNATFACLMVCNRLDYRRLAARPGLPSGAAAILPWRLRSLPRQLGFTGPVQMHPLILDQNRVIEVLQRHGYASRLEYPHRRERLRELLLGRRGAPLFSSAMALVACRAAGAGSLAQTLVKQVSRDIGESASLDPLGHFLVLRRKTIFQLPAHRSGPLVASADCGRVIVVPREPDGWQGRVNEMHTLRCLGADPRLAPQVPRVLTSGEFHGRPFSVIEHIPGVVVDGRVADLSVLSERAAGFITRLQAATLAPVRLDETSFAALFGELVESAGQRHPGLRAEIDDLGACLWSFLRRRAVPTVVEHGDFKIENVIIDPASRRLRAVIDWEMSRLQGLPLLDLLYLLIYNRMFEPGQTFESLCRSVVLTHAWSEGELTLINSYLARVPVTPPVRVALGAFFPLHALAQRFQVDPGATELIENWRKLLRVAARVMRQLADRSSSREARRHVGKTAAVRSG